MLRVRSIQQTNVERDARASRKLLEEPAGDVRAQAADARLREVDVRDEQRVVRRLDHDARKRLVRRHDREAVPARRILSERRRECAAEGAAGLGHLGLRRVRLDLEGEVEARVVRQAAQEMVEHREPGLDARRARPVKLHANPAPSGRGHGPGRLQESSSPKIGRSAHVGRVVES
jgi:hypothetical protein